MKIEPEHKGGGRRAGAGALLRQQWFSHKRGLALIRTPDAFTLKGKRDRALLALLVKAGLRRSEVAELTFEQIGWRDGHWFMEMKRGEGKPEEIPLPRWIKDSIDRWAAAAHLNHGRVFRAMNRWGAITRDGLSAQSVYAQLVVYGYWIGLRMIPFVPSRLDVVSEMLSVARLKRDDILYDLGSGDGRIVIEAARRFGVRGVGVEVDPERIQKAKAKARAAGVEARVSFIQEDIFRAEISDASVVTLFLLPGVNLELRPKLLSELKPGSRVISHRFHLGDWKPQRIAEVRGDRIYCCVVPTD
jgi:hypothetical protein